jgi:hypothetical protein
MRRRRKSRHRLFWRHREASPWDKSPKTPPTPHPAAAPRDTRSHGSPTAVHNSASTPSHSSIARSYSWVISSAPLLQSHPTTNTNESIVWKSRMELVHTYARNQTPRWQNTFACNNNVERLFQVHELLLSEIRYNDSNMR